MKFLTNGFSNFKNKHSSENYTAKKEIQYVLVIENVYQFLELLKRTFNFYDNNFTLELFFESIYRQLCVV